MTKTERQALKAWLQQATLEDAGAKHDDGARVRLNRLFGKLAWFLDDGRTDRDAVQLAEAVRREDGGSK